VNIRPHKPEDIPVLARLFTDTIRAVNVTDYSSDQIAAWSPDPPDLDFWRKRLKERLVFVAEEDSKIIGFATFESSGHLDHLYVHKNFQRRGIASALYECIEQEAVSNGIHRIFTEASITARPFFERAGFQLISRQTVEHNAVSFVNYRMEKFL
jgi:putative acetyltransferase